MLLENHFATGLFHRASNPQYKQIALKSLWISRSFQIRLIANKLCHQNIHWHISSSLQCAVDVSKSKLIMLMIELITVQMYLRKSHSF